MKLSAFSLFVLLVLLSGCWNETARLPSQAPASKEATNSLQKSREFAEEFDGLFRYEKWQGNRLRVVGMDDGMPVTENAGPWNISIAPTDSVSMIEIKGLFFAAAHDCTVRIDLVDKALLIGDTTFAGSKISGKSPMFQGTEFVGFSFENDHSGSASILFLNDGRLCMDFHKTIVNNTRAQEYGVLTGRQTED